MTATFNLSSAILARLEAQAARERRTVDDLVDEALRLVLDPDSPTSGREAGQPGAVTHPRFGWLYEDSDGRPLPFPVFYGAEFPAGVDPSSNASLFAAADAEEGEKYTRFADGELS